jgi:hypothetical protein
MQHRHGGRHRSLGNLGLQRCLACAQIVQSLLKIRRPQAIDDRVDKPA